MGDISSSRATGVDPGLWGCTTFRHTYLHMSAQHSAAYQMPASHM